ncbi:hypothetical protein [Microvirus mar10]|uniref:Uncharacterized protein n=1 Tax=Microvirus mar10 TaxID=2851142 RepID=A0A8F5MIY6_9VIRU|nr:hypothetical protein [Microvirus mar10]
MKNVVILTKCYNDGTSRIEGVYSDFDTAREIIENVLLDGVEYYKYCNSTLYVLKVGSYLKPYYELQSFPVLEILEN